MSETIPSPRVRDLLGNKTIIGGALLLVAIAIVIWLGGGCQATQPKTISPITKQPATAAEIAVQLEQWKADQEKASMKLEADLRAQLQEAQATASAEVRRIQEEANATIAKARTITQLETEAVASKANREAEAVTQQAAIVVQKVEAAQQQARAAIVLDTKALDIAIDAAEQNLKEQVEQRQAVLAALQPFAATVPGGSQAVGLLGLLLGGGAGGLGMLEAVRKRREAAAANAEKKQIELTAADVIASLDVLKEKDPAFAAAFKAHEKLLKEWQGEAGVALVSRLQK